MNEFMQDPVFYWLMWSIFSVAGILLGWQMRELLVERKYRVALERTEQEKNTLARMYTYLKHQHELREADFKKVSLELSMLRRQSEQLEQEQSRRSSADQGALLRAERAEEQAAQYASKIAALELVSKHLQDRNQALNGELQAMQQELDAWQVLYRDFQQMQQKLALLEQSSQSLEQERAKLHASMDHARTEIETLNAELDKARTQLAKRGAIADRKGGPAAPEHSDDLKSIKGISATTERNLHAMGIYTFDQISRWDDDVIVAFAKALGISPGKIYKDDWVGQARHLVAGNK
jgi:predicted flap endonuclease-1-like 5' DNA nuclease